MELGPNSVHWSNYVPAEYRVMVRREKIENKELFVEYRWMAILLPEYVPDLYVCIFKRRQPAIELYEKLKQLKIVTYGNWF